MAIVKVDIRDDDQSADLVSALSARMAHCEILSKQLVIFELSDVVTFQLMRHDNLPSYSRTSSLPRQPFRYPKHERECRNCFRQMETTKGNRGEHSEFDSTGECSQEAPGLDL